MTDAIERNEIHKGQDGIVRAPLATAWVRGLLEVNNVWLVLMAATAGFFVWQAITGDVPPIGQRLLTGAAAGGTIGFALSGFVTWRRGQRLRAENAALGERLIEQAAVDGIPADGRGRGCVVINDTSAGAVDGLIADPRSRRMALIVNGEVIYGSTGDLRTAPSDRAAWSRVRHQNHPTAVALLPVEVVQEIGLSG
jgi:hypothetical protein